MTAGTQQVVALYEENGLSIDEIAEQLELEPSAVKIALMQFSDTFRSKIEAEEAQSGDTFNGQDFEAARRVMARLVHSEDENVALKASKFVINERKGRHDPKNFRALNINVHMFNETLQKARAAKEAALGKTIELMPANVG